MFIMTDTIQVHTITVFIIHNQNYWAFEFWTIKSFGLFQYSGYPTIWNTDFLKVGFQMVQFSNCQALAVAIAIVPTIQKPDHSKSKHFCPDFKWFLTKWLPFVLISNGFGFQISDPIQNPDHSLLDHSKSRLGYVSDPTILGSLLYSILCSLLTLGTCSCNYPQGGRWFYRANRPLWLQLPSYPKGQTFCQVVGNLKT